MQQRRTFRKELLTWTKKVPVLVGLEVVAETLLGRDLVNHLLQPFSSLEDDDVRDWMPSDNCVYCDTSIQDGLIDEDGEAGLPITFPNYFLRENGDDNQPLDLSSTAPRSPSSDVNIPQQKGQNSIELKVPHVKKTEKLKRDGSKRNYTDTELQAAVQEIRDGKIGTRRAAVLYGIPRSTLRNKIYKLDMEAQQLRLNKNLTMGDLLQNGTAAAASSRSISPGNNNRKESPSIVQQNGTNNKTDDDESESWEKKLELIRRKHNLQSFVGMDMNLAALIGESAAAAAALGFIPKLDLSDAASQASILPEIARKMIEQRMEIESKLLVNGDSNDVETVESTVSNNFNHHHQVELKIPSYKPQHRISDEQVSSPASSIPASDTSADVAGSGSSSNNRINDTLKEIITKTITEKIRSRFVGSNETYPNLQHYLNNGNKQHASNSNGSATSGTAVNGSAGPSPSKKLRKSDANNKDSSTGSNTGSEQQPVKKTRPKRGQYRKYNNALLMEAVRAVQRGEMSVHRAGSYYGVPHSTLEYKVKERHLLRQKKKAEEKRAQQQEQAQQTNQKSTPQKISPAKPSSQNTSSKTSPNNTSMSLPDAVTSLTAAQASAAAANLMAQLQFPAAAASAAALFPSQPFLTWPVDNNAFLPAQAVVLPNGLSLAEHPELMYGPGFALNTPASELLKKLQQKVQSGEENGDSKTIGSPEKMSDEK
ncbi:uncharacterized protein LOC141900088 [Tubulanus polymorphus]|uniref:uncharacterized protein LOC141900088 n=1 Tax=Tubulanus polymorphus TaxID=672921 RepID=UPI003DA4B795